MKFNAVFFDLHGTLAYKKSEVSDAEACELLGARGLEVYPQAYKAVWQYVMYIDYPKYGYSNWQEYCDQVLRRFQLPSRSTIEYDMASKELADLFERKEEWAPYPEVEESMKRVKEVGLKTAIVSTIPQFRYKKYLRNILGMIDLPLDGYSFHREKSDPRMYSDALKKLDVRADQAVMVGNEYELDVLEPKMLGLESILMNRDRLKISSKEYPKANLVAEDLSEAVKMILKMK